MSKLLIFSGNANPKLSNKIIEYLDINLGKLTITKFSDGEISIKINENVRGKDVFVIQSTCMPTNNNIIELILIIDALQRASANRITAVIPYFGYARQDRRVYSARVPISAKVIANMIVKAGVNRVMTMDLHSEQIQGFFDVPVDNIYGNPVLINDIYHQNYKNMLIVSPDIGGVIRARAAAQELNLDLAIIDKRRPKINESQVMHIIGDVNNRICILLDDIIDTANTICKAAEALKLHGAKRIVAYSTHAILSGSAIDNILKSNIDELVVSDTIPLAEKAILCSKIRQITVSSIIAEAIRRVNNEESVSAMFT
ncbi:Ribose-phosphate pyrophosphokinase [Candidatus Johnevansia muelleri]|uniref:Ribose-phosphate pyrophosphokinase n=1 Tax=Candidatus Johnevansia muelleri TaxID=1495769 RepID=A0A078KI59_9GAMM|nr:Ribose-phosphate pyrophosphokinase [Candidatus Evansia muelleri]